MVTFSEETMDGAESLLHTAAAAGVEVCFANPGTSELPLVLALDRVPSVRPVLGLFEGVCTGAADGYGRMSARPALTLLHLGPGLANGLANLHDARRAGTPIVNLVGQHATWHVGADAPLTSDIASLAASVSGWVHTATSAETLAADAADAIAAAAAGRVATLIIPSDYQWEPAPGPSAPRPVPSPEPVPEEAVEAAAKALTTGPPAVLLLGGAALSEPGLCAAARISQAAGCRLVAETFPARIERGGGLPAPERLPYPPDLARATLDAAPAVVLAGAREPVTFFGYPGEPSSMVPPGTAVCSLAPAAQDARHDIVDALERLADRLGAPEEVDAVPSPAAGRPSGRLTPETLAAAVATCQPEGVIVTDEAVSSGFGYFPLAAGAPRHTYIGHVGGALGQGLPLAAGAAIACPDRPVLALQADGSGMYTPQALWTHAREGLDVTTVICSNRAYRVLQSELVRGGHGTGDPATKALLDLDRPELDWVHLAQGMGVPAERVGTAGELISALERGFAEPGPHLVEAVL
jgi:acetolactate synthase-1/2/3 large subunit